MVYLTNGDANRLWRLQEPTSRKVFNELVVAPPAALDAVRITDETASAPSSGRLTLTAAQSMRQQETPVMSLQLVPLETPICVSYEHPKGETSPLVQVDDRAPHGREARGADFEDRRLHTIIVQLMVQVGPLQLRVLALASISPAGDRRMRARPHPSSSNAVRHARGEGIGWIISESSREMLLPGKVGDDDYTAARGLASCGSLGSGGGSASSGEVSAAGNSGPAPRLSLRQILRARQQPAHGHAGQQGALVRPMAMSGGRIPVPAGMQQGRDQKSLRLPPSAVVAGGGGYPRGVQVDSPMSDRTKEHVPGEKMEPGPSELPTDEDAPITTGTSTDRGSTVPVRQPAAYHETTRCIPPLPLHPPQPCKRRLLHEHNDGRGDSALQDALRFMHEGSRPTPPTLSERRQFAARHPRRPVTQPVALTVSITRNKRGWRGRRIAESADRAPLGEVVMHSACGTGGISACLAKLGLGGRVSERFPARANLGMLIPPTGRYGDVRAGRGERAAGDVWAARDVRAVGNVCAATARNVRTAGDVRAAWDVVATANVRAAEDADVPYCAPSEFPQTSKPSRTRRGRRGGRRRGRRSARAAGGSDTESAWSTALPGRHGRDRRLDGNTSRIGSGGRLVEVTPPEGRSAEGKVSEPDSRSPTVASVAASARALARLERDEELATADAMAPDPEREEAAQGERPAGKLQLDSLTEKRVNWPAGQRAREEKDPMTDAIEVRIVKDKGECRIEVRREDWLNMQALELGPHVGLVLRFAYHRSRGGRQEQHMANMRFVPYDAEHLQLGRCSRPSTWEEMVQHTERGGFYRIAGVLRGGMDPELEGLLNSTAFVDALPWTQIDEALARVRNGDQFSKEETMVTHIRLAQALASSVALQQWEPLAAFLGTQPLEERTAMILSPARLAALSVVALRRPPAAAPPPQWVLDAQHVDLRFNHLHLDDFVPGAQPIQNIRGQLQDAIVDRVIHVAPAIQNHARYRLVNLRADTKVEINYRDPGIFSATMVLPNGQWIVDFYQGNIKIGRESFCTLVMAETFFEAEISNVDKQIIRAVRSALALDGAVFRRVIEASLDAAIQSKTARFRDTTVRYIPGNGRGKGTKEHVSPDSQESSLLVSMDVNSLLVARRTATRLAWRLGNPDTQECPVTIGFTLPQVPHHVQRCMLTVRDPAIIRLRIRGNPATHQSFLVGPLPKDMLPEHVTKSGARMAVLRDVIHTASTLSLQTREARFLGKYEKNRGPMFLYMEFNSLDVATQFAAISDQQIPPALCEILKLIAGGVAFPNVQLWECALLAETLDGADEKTLKQLMSHGQPAAPGTGAAAGGPDNPGGGGH